MKKISPKLKEIQKNIDGEEINYEEETLVEKVTYETATILRRLAAYMIDAALIIAIVFLISLLLFKKIDAFVATVGTDEKDFNSLMKYEEFVELFWRLMLNLFLTWNGVRLVYFTLVPAILGNGRTIGKLVAGIGVVDAKTLNEASPSKLILREFIGRILVETIFIIPGIISMFIALQRKDSKTLKDLIANTAVIRLDLYDIE